MANNKTEVKTLIKSMDQRNFEQQRYFMTGKDIQLEMLYSLHVLIKKQKKTAANTFILILFLVIIPYITAIIYYLFTQGIF